MKAISPMIAVVLLIAFTVGVGGLIALFSTGLTTTSTGLTQNQSQSLTRCASTWVNVFRVTNTTISYSNQAGETITNLIATFSDGKQGVTTLDQSLAPGESNATQITNGTGASTGALVVLTGIAPGGATGNTSVILRGQCQGNVIVEGRCRAGQSCWEL